MQEKRLIIIFILSIIIGVGIIFVIQNKGFIIGENKEKREYLRALNLIEEKKWKQAEDILMKLSNKNTEEGKYDFHIGNIKRNTNDYSNALIFYEKALKKSSDIKEIYNNLAGIYMVQGEMEKALEIVNEGLKLYPQYEELTFKKGQLLFTFQRYKESIETLEKIVSKDRYFEVYRFMGLSYYYLQDKQNAITNLKEYLAKVNDEIKEKTEIEKLILQIEENQ